MRPLRVLLVDDSESFLKSASDFLSCDPRLRIVGSAMNGRDGVAMAEHLAPDLVLMDLAMPELDGLAATGLMRSLPAPPRVFLITLLDSSAYRSRADSVGALALISKANFAEEVQAALDTLLSSGGSAVTCPPMPGNEPAREADTASARSVHYDAETILVVEDEEAVRILAARVLRSAGYNVVAVRDGMEALAAAKAGDNSPAVLVADIVLPGIGGRALADRIRTICPGIKVVFTSGGMGDALSDEDFATDAGHVLAKPYTPSRLLEIVREALASPQA